MEKEISYRENGKDIVSQQQVTSLLLPQETGVSLGSSSCTSCAHWTSHLLYPKTQSRTSLSNFYSLRHIQQVTIPDSFWGGAWGGTWNTANKCGLVLFPKAHQSCHVPDPLPRTPHSLFLLWNSLVKGEMTRLDALGLRVSPGIVESSGSPRAEEVIDSSTPCACIQEPLFLSVT